MTLELPAVRGTALERAMQCALVALWLLVLPALLAGLVMRYLVPAVGWGGWPSVVVLLARRFPVPLAVGLFLLFAGLVGYWRYAIPGGRYASVLPVRLLRGQSGRDVLAAWACEVAFYERARQPGFLRAARNALGAERFAVVLAGLDDLRAALESSDGARAAAGRQRVEAAAAGEIARWRRRRALRVGGAMAAALAAVLGARACLFEPYRIEGTSMLPTLEPLDLVVGNKRVFGLAGGREPRRGDLVVFRSASVALPRGQSGVPEVLVKRVIGLPGDSVEMRDDVAVINGWPVPTCEVGTYAYLLPDASGGSLRSGVRVEFLEGRAYLTLAGSPAPFPGPYRVKPGEVFVLGDNRASSLDSRAYNAGEGGGVPLAALPARAEWFVAGTRRSGRADLSRLLRPMAAVEGTLRADVPDRAALEPRLARCLRDQPRDTSPPAPSPAPTSR